MKLTIIVSINFLLNWIGDISESVLTLLDKAGAINDVHFEDEEVEGKVHEVEADNEEDMLVYSCYIAECLTFSKPIDLNTKGVKFLRNKILDSILGLTYIWNNQVRVITVDTFYFS